MEARTEPINETRKDSLVKRVLLAGGETANALKISYVSGLALGATGRFTGAEWIPAIPPVIDLFHGVSPTAERVACYMAYGAGIATAYADKVYSAVVDITDKL